jgi:hypothetical protein
VQYRERTSFRTIIAQCKALSGPLWTAPAIFLSLRQLSRVFEISIEPSAQACTTHQWRATNGGFAVLSKSQNHDRLQIRVVCRPELSVNQGSLHGEILVGNL